MPEMAVEKVFEKLGISQDDYMMLYFDFPQKKVMAIDHLGKQHVPVGDIYDLVIKGGNVMSFKIKKPGIKTTSNLILWR